MRALGISFEDEVLCFEEDNFERFRAISPAALVPCLRDGERLVWDSLAIAEYLAERHLGVWPKDEDARAWARCAAAEMHGGFGPLRNQCPMNVGVRARLRHIDEGLQRNINRIDELFNEGIKRFGGPWLAGADLTAVDAFYAPVAYRIRTYGLDVSEVAMAWVEHVITHPQMLAWEQVALSETYREVAQETELAATADILDDHRTG